MGSKSFSKFIFNTSLKHRNRESYIRLLISSVWKLFDSGVYVHITQLYWFEAKSLEIFATLFRFLFHLPFCLHNYATSFLYFTYTCKIRATVT